MQEYGCGVSCINEQRRVGTKKEKLNLIGVCCKGMMIPRGTDG